MPPAAFSSSTAMVRPLWVDWPKVASEPVIEPYSPITISAASAGLPPAAPPSVDLQPDAQARPSAANGTRSRFRTGTPEKVSFDVATVRGKVNDVLERGRW